MEKVVNRIKKTRTSIPRTLTQAEALLAKIGRDQDSINEIEAELKAKIAELKAEAKKKLRPLLTRRTSDVNALFAFASPRKADLTKKARSVKLSTGVFGWRWTTPRVELAKSEAEAVLMLERTGNEDFVRIIKEVDRQALLSERPIIPGITYEQDEEFFVVPRQKAKKAKTLTQAVDRC